MLQCFSLFVVLQSIHRYTETAPTRRQFSPPCWTFPRRPGPCKKKAEAAAARDAKAAGASAESSANPALTTDQELVPAVNVYRLFSLKEPDMAKVGGTCFCCGNLPAPARAFA